MVYVPGSGDRPEDGNLLRERDSCLKKGCLGCFRWVVSLEDEVERSVFVQSVGVEGRDFRGREGCERCPYPESEVEGVVKGNRIRSVDHAMAGLIP